MHLGMACVNEGSHCFGYMKIHGEAKSISSINLTAVEHNVLEIRTIKMTLLLLLVWLSVSFTPMLCCLFDVGDGCFIIVECTGCIRMKLRRCLSRDADVAQRRKWKLTEVSDSFIHIRIAKVDKLQLNTLG